MKKTLLILLLVGALLPAWGVVIEPRLLDHTHHSFSLPDLPPEWLDKRIVLFADLQVGMWFDNASTVRKAAESIAAMNPAPAAAFIAGDFIYSPTEDESLEEAAEEYREEGAESARELMQEVVELLAPLFESNIPVYAVLGNHDYAMERESALKLEWVAKELSAALDGAGVRVLHNESALMYPGSEGRGTPIHVVGIGPYYAGEDDPAKALASVPEGAPRIVLMHNPQSFSKFGPGQAPLALAAHTHGGQIRIPFLPAWSWLSIVKEKEVHADGWITNPGAPGNHLYVNRGIGFSKVPIRINCRPEVTVITLK